MYIQVSLQRGGDFAKLVFSPPSVAIGKWSCLKFYYRMYGDYIKRLNVFSSNCIVFTKWRQQGNMWLYAEMDVLVQDNVSSLKTAQWSIT